MKRRMYFEVAVTDEDCWVDGRVIARRLYELIAEGIASHHNNPAYQGWPTSFEVNWEETEEDDDEDDGA